MGMCEDDGSLSRQNERGGAHCGTRLDPDELDELFRIGATRGSIFDDKRLRRILANLEKEGVSVRRGQDAELHLRASGAAASYMPDLGHPGILFLRDEATEPEVIEELIHVGQNRKTGWGPMTVEDEIAAQDLLLRIGRRRGWSESIMKQIEKAKAFWIARSEGR